MTPPAIRRALPRLCEDGTIVCVATGPSLTVEDVRYCRDKAPMVVVNDAHRMAPWADVLYSSDRYWWTHYRGVPEFSGLKATIEFSPGRAALDLQRFVPEMHFLRNTGHDGIETAPDGIRTCRQNSGGAAVNLALHLGAKRIVLLGYDCNALSGRHFFGDHPSPINGLQHFPTWRQGFLSMRDPFEALGVMVLNCSRSTSIEAFACVPLEAAL